MRVIAQLATLVVAGGVAVVRPVPLRVGAQLAVAAHADTVVPDFRILDTLIDSEMKATATPGAAVAVVLGNQVVYVRYAGVASVETGVAVTEQTLFRTASTTKMLTAAATLIEAERLRLDLTAPVGGLARGLPATFRAASLRELLTHSGGMRDGASYYGPHDDDALERAVRSWPSDYRFAPAGDVFSYSNLGYDLAARVLESVTGDRFADLMRRALFAPFGMTHSTVRPLEAMTYPFAQGHDLDADGIARVVRPFADDSRYWANGGVFTTAVEFSRFVRTLLNGGQLDGRAVMSPALTAEMLRGYVDVPGTRASEHAQYGYGLNVKTLRGFTTLQHGGERIGFGSVVRMVAEQRFGIVILTNRTGSYLPKTLEAASALAVPSRPVPAKEGQPFTSLEARAGRYVNVPDTLAFEVIGSGNGFLLRRSGDTAAVALVRSADGRYVAGDLALVFVKGKRSGKHYMHLAGRSLRRIDE